MNYIENAKLLESLVNNDSIEQIEKKLNKRNNCIFTFNVDPFQKKIVSLQSNCTNIYKVDFQKYIQDQLLVDLSSRILFRSIANSANSFALFFISIRNVNHESVLISFVNISDLNEIGNENIDMLEKSILIHENNLILKNSSNIINELKDQINTLFEIVDNSKKIAIPTINGFVLKRASSIMYCIADGNYTNIYYVDSKKDCISKPLCWLEKKLSTADSFFKIHKSQIINNLYVKEIKSNQVIMTDGKTLEISIRRKNDVKKHYGLM